MREEFKGVYTNLHFFYRLLLNTYEGLTTTITLTFGEFIVLLSICHNDIKRQKDLMKISGYSISSVNKMIVTLEEEGYIERVKEIDKKYSVNEKGKELLGNIEKELYGTLEDILEYSNELKSLYYNLCIKDNIKGNDNYRALYLCIHKLYTQSKRFLFFADGPFTYSEYILIKVLDMKKGINQRKVAKLLSYDYPRINQLTQSLIKGGYLEATNVYQGKRLSKELELSSKGEKELRTLDDAIVEYFFREHRDDKEIFLAIVINLKIIIERLKIKYRDLIVEAS